MSSFRLFRAFDQNGETNIPEQQKKMTSQFDISNTQQGSNFRRTNVKEVRASLLS